MHDIIQILDPKFLISTFGLIGVIGIVFAESGLFFGFFLPGDSLLFTAGLFASQGYLNILILTVGVLVAAIVGDNVGYAFGKKAGPKIFTKEDSLFFNKKYVLKAQAFYEKHGNKTIILARFIPIVRTFAPIVAGIGGMNYSKFFTYNCIGATLWTFLMIGAGYILGEIIPGIDRYLLPIVFCIIFVSFIPAVWHLLKKN
jgi:membrane-associated protein